MSYFGRPSSPISHKRATLSGCENAPHACCAASIVFPRQCSCVTVSTTVLFMLLDLFPPSLSPIEMANMELLVFQGNKLVLQCSKITVYYWMWKQLLTNEFKFKVWYFCNGFQMIRNTSDTDMNLSVWGWTPAVGCLMGFADEDAVMPSKEKADFISMTFVNTKCKFLFPGFVNLFLILSFSFLNFSFFLSAYSVNSKKQPFKMFPVNFTIWQEHLGHHKGEVPFNIYPTCHFWTSHSKNLLGKKRKTILGRSY